MMVVVETCTRCDKSNTHISYLTLLDQEACEGEIGVWKSGGIRIQCQHRQ